MDFAKLIAEIKDNKVSFICIDEQLDEDELQQFISAFAENSSIHTLRIRNMVFPIDLMVSLSLAIKKNNVLKTLVITNSCHSGESRINPLAPELLSCPSITTLIFSQNGLTLQNIKDLAEAIKSNTTLMTLDLSANDITWQGLIALADALRVNRSLLQLTLRPLIISNPPLSRFTEREQALYNEAFIRALEHNTTLRTLDGFNHPQIATYLQRNIHLLDSRLTELKAMLINITKLTPELVQERLNELDELSQQHSAKRFYLHELKHLFLSISNLVVDNSQKISALGEYQMVALLCVEFHHCDLQDLANKLLLEHFPSLPKGLSKNDAIICYKLLVYLAARYRDNTLLACDVYDRGIAWLYNLYSSKTIVACADFATIKKTGPTAISYGDLLKLVATCLYWGREAKVLLPGEEEFLSAVLKAFNYNPEVIRLLAYSPTFLKHLGKESYIVLEQLIGGTRLPEPLGLKYKKDIATPEDFTGYRIMIDASPEYPKLDCVIQDIKLQVFNIFTALQTPSHEVQTSLLTPASFFFDTSKPAEERPLDSKYTPVSN